MGTDIKKNKSYKKHQAILIVLYILFTVKYLWILYSTSSVIRYLSLPYLILFFLLIPIFFFLTKLTHELGHFIFGKFIGYQLLYFQVGFLEWRNQQGKIKFSICRNLQSQIFCYILPHESNYTAKQRAFYYSGGVCTSFILLVLIFSCLLFTNYYFYPALFFALATANLICEIDLTRTGLPFINPNKPTDGEIVWGLLHQNTLSKHIMAIDDITIQMTFHKRPREIQLSKDIFEQNQDSSNYYSYILFSYYKALDSNDIHAMQSIITYIESHLSEITDTQLIIFYYELVYYYSAIKLNVDKANLYYDPIKTILKSDKSMNAFRVLGSYEYYVNHNKDTAMKCVAKSIASTNNYSSKGQSIMEKDLIYQLQKDVSNKASP